MKTILAVVNEARTIYGDEYTGDQTFWSDATLLEFLNDGRKELYGAMPSIYELTEVVTLVAGYRQTLPNGSKKLFNIINNESHAEKRAITPIDREILGRVRPRWRYEEPMNEMYHYMYTGTEPAKFECYPPLLSGVTVLMSYARPPIDYTLLELNGLAPPTLVYEAELAVGLIDYILFRMYQKQADQSPDYASRSREHLALFSARIPGTEQARRASNPNVTSKSANPKAAAG